MSGDFTFQAGARAAVPLMIDTDIWSSADDVGALAAAFGLQLRGEAKVIAVGVNTRRSRPAVAADSWRCVAAITAFYGFSSVPIGAAFPDNGTAANTPDFVGPCARLAPAGTSAPESVVRVFRRALTAQPNGSVVMASIGYFGNLSALLDSRGDDISALTGRELVQRKVKAMVAMAGAYPSGSVETNLVGDPTAAQNVASHWPTTIVWSGLEVGDQVHTGQTISSVHPASSPVRAAYEAFVGAGNWIYSYDLTALYHAVRPDDSSLAEVGPGTNAVTDSGGNVFTSGSGNQYYLSLKNTAGLDASIEALLDKLP
jgi:inosine-uridine nucleoside N-ribohydrolase